MYFRTVKEALSLSVEAVSTAEHRRNSKPELYNQFLFCNMFLLYRRYLHGGNEDVNKKNGVQTVAVCTPFF